MKNINKSTLKSKYVPAQQARYQRVGGEYVDYVKQGEVGNTAVWRSGPCEINVTVKRNQERNQCLLQWFGAAPMVWELVEAIEAYASHRATKNFNWAEVERAYKNARIFHRSSGKLRRVYAECPGKGTKIGIRDGHGRSAGRVLSDHLHDLKSGEWFWTESPEIVLGLAWALDDQIPN